MAGWTQHSGWAVGLPFENVDTDQLIPARFMSRPRKDGYGDYLLHDIRRNPDDTLRGDWPINAHPHATVLVARRNFGGGSSREAAAYALVDAGIRAVLAPSFGDIFSGNAANNALLAAQITESDADILLAALGHSAAPASITLDTRTARIGPHEVSFALSDMARTKLMQGWDDIDLTLADTARIAAYRDARHQTTPWAWPRVTSGTAGS